jgi:uncharacterized protein (TIGR02646 family)
VIYINMDGKTPPSNWLSSAQALTQQLNDATTYEDRCRIIDQNRDLWGGLKQWLLEQSSYKCWYAEARNDSSHFEVEHFRPKKWQTDPENPNFDGYWWLAFDWHNYRVCGNAPNRKKGAFFPLHPHSRRASGDRQQLVEDEIFCLLDPTDPNDSMLLSFNEDGDAIPMPGKEGWDEERAKVSIERYGLNSLPQLCEGRRRVWQECRALIDELSQLYSKTQNTPTATARTEGKEKTKQLLAKMKRDQPFSATARECLLASGYPWAQRLAAA